MCIKRDDMPQIDWIHYAALIEFCIQHGVSVRDTVVNPRLVKFVQCMEHPFHRVSPKTKAKPVLLSQDHAVIDGNHRAGTWLAEGAPLMPSVSLGLRFGDAVKFIWRFPYTYRYGDGKFHPRTI